MKQFDYFISGQNGLHARPAGNLVKLAKQYQSTVTITAGDKTSNCKKLFSIMELGTCLGKQITIIINGTDEESCFSGIESFFKENL